MGAERFDSEADEVLGYERSTLTLSECVRVCERERRREIERDRERERARERGREGEGERARAREREGGRERERERERGRLLAVITRGQQSSVMPDFFPCVPGICF